MSKCVIFVTILIVNAMGETRVTNGTTVDVIFSSGECNHVSMKGHFEVSAYSYDFGTAKSEKKVAVTDMDAFMSGYIAVSPAQDRIVFTAQTQKNGEVSPHVENWIVSFGEATESDTEICLPLLNDTQGDVLLAPCRTESPDGLAPCVETDSFFPNWATNPHHPDRPDVLFSYRAWTPAGFPRGNQALARVRGHSGAVERLTYNGTLMAMHTSDTCPIAVPGTEGRYVLFVRELMEGLTRVIAQVDTQTGAVTEMHGLPQPTEWGGCPAFIPMTAAEEKKPPTFMYIGDDRAGGAFPIMYAVDTASRVESPWSYSAQKQWTVPLVDTRDVLGALSVQYCSRPLVSKTDSKTARTTSPVLTHDVIACINVKEHVSLLNATSGAYLQNLTVARRRGWAMTPYPFRVIISA